MDNRGLPPQTSNFDCLPGRAGGTPNVLVHYFAYTVDFVSYHSLRLSSRICDAQNRYFARSTDFKTARSVGKW